MEDIINDIIKSNPTNSYEQEEPDPKEEAQNKEILKCNVWRCKKCHPNSPPLSQEQIAQIREKMTKSKKPRRLKGCNHPTCKYCERLISVANKYIQEFNDNLKEKHENKNEIQIEQESAKNKVQLEEQPNEIIIADPPSKYIDTNKINDYTKLDTTKDGNCCPRAILRSCGLDEEEHPIIRQEIAKAIKEFNWNPETLTALGYEDKDELAEQAAKQGNFLGYQELIPFLTKYNIKCHLYTKDLYYKGSEWLTLNEKQNQPQEEITLWYQQGSNHQNLTGHFLALVKNNTYPTQFKQKLLLLINQIKRQNQINTKVNILLWNLRSINPQNQSSKIGYLIQTLYEQNIQIALLQETMLSEDNKIYIKGFKIYRADAPTNRRGVAILISNQLKCESYIIIKDPLGRYIQVKLRDKGSNQETLIATAYVEPDQDSNPQIIPKDIWESTIFAGDLNKMNSNLTKIENVYHLKNIGVFQEKIIVPNIISDHQILIFTKEIPIPLNQEYEDIIIQDKNIFKETESN